VIPFRRNPDRGPRDEDFGNLVARGSNSDWVTMHRRNDLDGGRGDGPGAGARVRAPWLIGPLMLAAVAAGVLFVFRGPDHVFGIAFGVVLGLGFLWILVSTMFPSKADRTCPRCGAEALVRLDPHTTRGLACTACAWSDEHASSFYLAEEEGPFEDDVLGQRAPGRPPRRW